MRGWIDAKGWQRNAVLRHWWDSVGIDRTMSPTKQWMVILFKAIITKQYIDYASFLSCLNVYQYGFYSIEEQVGHIDF